MSFAIELSALLHVKMITNDSYDEKTPVFYDDFYCLGKRAHDDKKSLE